MNLRSDRGPNGHGANEISRIWWGFVFGSPLHKDSHAIRVSERYDTAFVMYGVSTLERTVLNSYPNNPKSS